MPTVVPSRSYSADARSSMFTPASRRIVPISSPRPSCRSWFPRTAQTGIERPRQASASTTACSDSPRVVRSPASRTRSASSCTRTNDSRIRPRVASDACTSPAAAILTTLQCCAIDPNGKPRSMATLEDDFRELLETMKKAGGILNDAGVPWVLGGGLACWARGGPETEHDVDFLVKPADPDRAQHAFAEAGLNTEGPPGGWLVSAWLGGVLVGRIFHPQDGRVDEGL